MDEDDFDFLAEIRADHEKQEEAEDQRRLEQDKQEKEKLEIDRRNGIFSRPADDQTVEVLKEQVKSACDHIELFHQICLKCNEFLNDNQIKNIAETVHKERGEKDDGEFDLDGEDDADDETIEYREYALLGRGRGHLIRSDHCKQFIQREVDTLFKNKRLVLVLDLDSTLIHTADNG